MKNIIAQSLEKLYKEFERLDTLFLESDMKSTEMLEQGLFDAARLIAAEHMEALYNSVDQTLCDDIYRTEKYTVQRHDTRELLTINGPIHFRHTLFCSREDGSYHYLLDEWMGLESHERLSCCAEAAVLKEVVQSSYSRAAKALGKDAEISKTAVMDKVHAVEAEIPFPRPVQKKVAEYLYIEADEDHIHKQDKISRDKKGGMIGKLLYLYEGQEEKYGRRELKNVFYLGGLYSGSEENHRLFRRMQQYIETNYDTKYLKTVYISGDCGNWIKAGVNDIDRGVMVMDKYHLMKYINKAANQMLDDTNEVKGRLWKSLYKGKRKKFIKTIRAVRKCAANEKAVNECEEYVLNNWDSAVRRMQDKNVYGCSAEGHVSHVYSDRMSSRPMGWSEEGADAMCKLRCYVRDFGEEKIIDLVKYRRAHKEQATGTDGAEVKVSRGYMKTLLYRQHDSDRVYIEKMQATIPSMEIKKTLAIRERIGNI
ncbi:MAG: ISLre2 family transposase [Lachnospiraceae bacterium]|nr:ISLre2 family transposase [Lachnospiraceae bacterium]